MARGNAEIRSNFSFLAEHAPLLADLGATAEKLYPFDPASSVLKLRLLGESLTQEVASRIGLRLLQPTQAELLRAVDQRLGLDAQLRQMFHLLRVRGNEAAHQADHRIGYREGLEALKVAREVALWFHRTFGSEPDFKPGPFILPDDPSQKLLELQRQVATLTQNLQQAQSEQAANSQLAALLSAQAAQERELAERASEEREIYEDLAEEASARFAALKAQFDERLQSVASQPAVASGQDIHRFSQRASRAAQQVTLDEAGTRLLIDQLLRDAGWEVDTNVLTYAKGTFPSATAIWRSPSGRHRGNRAPITYCLPASSQLPRSRPSARTSTSPEKSDKLNVTREGSGIAPNLRPRGWLKAAKPLGPMAKAKASGCHSSIHATGARSSSRAQRPAGHGSGTSASLPIWPNHCRVFIRQTACWTCFDEASRTRRND